jgi:hypothetical protein
MRADDPLQESYAREAQLLDHGDIVWGRVVQANSLLFTPGADDCPADVLFASGPARVPMASLDRAAEAAFALKGTKPVDPDLARIAAALTDETGRHPPLDLPSPVTRGLPMRLFSLMIHRVHLPTRVLLSTAIPLVVNAARDAATVLPARFWAKDLVRGWSDLGAGG